MESCGPYELVIDLRGNIAAIGSRLGLLAGVTPQELLGRPVARWFRGQALSGAVGVPGHLELRGEGRPPVHGAAVRVAEGERQRLTFVPEGPRAASTDRGRGEDQRPVEAGREIQDALTGIVGFAGLVPVAPTPHRRKFYVDQIASQAERVRRLVGALVDPSERGPTPFIRPAELAVELSRALSGLRVALERGGIAFDLELGQGVWVACDIRLLGDLVATIIQRATLAQRRDYQANEVVVRSRPVAHSTVQLEIAMTGADQPHVLLRERFGTGDDGAAADAELRTGWLALERQGGNVTLVADPAREEVRLVMTLPSAPAPRRPDKLRTPVPLDVLVVDDDAMLGELYQEMLQVAGHSVTACRTLFGAREALRAQRFDAVIAEFQMKDGLLSELWAMASEAHPELASRLVVATRDPRDPRLTEFASQRDTPILAKPFTAAALSEQLALLV